MNFPYLYFLLQFAKQIKHLHYYLFSFLKNSFISFSFKTLFKRVQSWHIFILRSLLDIPLSFYAICIQELYPKNWHVSYFLCWNCILFWIFYILFNFDVIRFSCNIIFQPHLFFDVYILTEQTILRRSSSSLSKFRQDFTMDLSWTVSNKYLSNLAFNSGIKWFRSFLNKLSSICIISYISFLQYKRTT